MPGKSRETNNCLPFPLPSFFLDSKICYETKMEEMLNAVDADKAISRATFSFAGIKVKK